MRPGSIRIGVAFAALAVVAATALLAVGTPARTAGTGSTIARAAIPDDPDRPHPDWEVGPSGSAEKRVPGPLGGFGLAMIAATGALFAIVAFGTVSRPRASAVRAAQFVPCGLRAPPALLPS